jgi:PAS domain S-box-containing protein
MFELSNDLLAVTGTDGYFRRVNPAFTRVLGWSAEEVLTRPINFFVHPADRARTLREIGFLSEGFPTYAFENRYRHRNGSYRWLRWTAAPVSEEGLIYAAARDVTDQRRMDERRQRVEHQRGELLGGVSDALQRAAARLSDIESGVSADSLDDLQRERVCLTDLADTLDALGRVERGGLVLAGRSFDLRDVVEGIVGDTSSELESSGWNVEFERPGTRLQITADERVLTETLERLVRSAVSRTDVPGQLSIELDYEEPGWTRLCLTVSRPGPRAVEEALAREVVLALGGSLEREATTSGMVITVRLPLEPESVSETPPPYRPGPSPRRILLVDPENEAATRFGQMLELRDHRVTVVSTGQEALAELGDWGADVVVSALNLSDMTGLQLAATIDSDPAFRQVILFAISESGDPESFIDAFDAGFDAHLVKPVSLFDFERALIPFDGEGDRLKD